MSTQIFGKLPSAVVENEHSDLRGTERVDRFAVTVSSELPARWPKASTPGEVCGNIFQMREFLAIWSDTYAERLGAAPMFVEGKREFLRTF